jgi:hypothetical protein
LGKFPCIFPVIAVQVEETGFARLPRQPRILVNWLNHGSPQKSPRLRGIFTQFVVWETRRNRNWGLWQANLGPGLRSRFLNLRKLWIPWPNEHRFHPHGECKGRRRFDSGAPMQFWVWFSQVASTPGKCGPSISG